MNNRDIKVSIIVPVYNVEQYLVRCLDSICDQTLNGIEIILIDDGSTDGSWEICKKYADRDNRIQILHKLNGGLVSARQAGLKVAKGKYVGFVDSDDWIEKDMYQKLYDTALYYTADVVVDGMIEDIEGQYKVICNQLPVGAYETIIQKKLLYKNMICCHDFFGLGIQPYLWNKLFRRELASVHICKIPQTIRVGEDAAATYPMIVMARKIVILGTAHYHYCLRKTSMILGNKKVDEEYDNAILLHTFFKKTFIDLSIYDVVRQQIQRYTINNIMTRAYSKVANIDAGSILFPFNGIQQYDSIIIYGAGALGKAVYQYALECGNLTVKAWIDKDADRYQKLGFNVQKLENIEIKDFYKIIIAVFDEAIYLVIRKNLIEKSVKPEQIRWIDNSRLLIGVLGLIEGMS